ncbi:MAG: hypothetical protein QNL04_05660 [SAR324 cluster bacterium]|nr:hypothetical protein [SAR324 cluster bacterium]
MWVTIAPNASALIPDRRKDQFSTEEAWYAVPTPYSLPGLGSGFIFAGLYTNMGESHVDALVAVMTGALTAKSVGLMDVHLIDETLVLNYFYSEIETITVNGYNGRGLDTAADDYNIYQIGDGSGSGGQISLKLAEQRLQFYYVGFTSSSTLQSVKDKDSNVLFETDGAEATTAKSKTTGAILDLTDDWSDPRAGLRASFTRAGAEGLESDSTAPEQYTEDVNVTMYIPIGKQSVWLFNYYTSDAVVTKEGLTDRTTLRSLMFGDVDCTTSADPTACESTIEQSLDDTVAANQYGTSSSLGGPGRLRAFPFARFRGAHTQFYGTEVRWNLTDEKTAFNFWLIKDVRTSIQLAAFHEQGSVAETKEDLSLAHKTSTGLGFRLVTGSGLVWRMDVAHGEDGNATQVIVSYPWGEPLF